MVTLDTNMRYQHPTFDLAVILVTARSNKRSALEPAMSEVNRVLPVVEPGCLYIVSEPGSSK